VGKTGSALVRVGSALFIVGLIAVLALFVVPAVDDGVTLPLWVYLCTPLTPIGLVVAIAGVVIDGSAGDDGTDD
jgi:hypothetical protein